MNLSELPSRHSLSTKLIVLSIVWLVTAMTAIGYTLLLSWKLQGGAAAINDAGSLRMRTYHMVALLSQQRPAEVIEKEQQVFGRTLERLLQGDPARPLFLPDNADVRQQADAIRARWEQHMRPLLHATSNTSVPDFDAINQQADGFVNDIDKLVRLVEIDNAHNTNLLRGFQLTLIAMALAGTVSMIYLLYLLIMLPMNQLQQAVQKLSDGDLSTRVEIDSKDEFGALSRGFNEMAGKLQDLYQTLEQKVREKTHALEANNSHLAALYEVTSFLHQSHNLEQTCEGFLRRIMALVQADAGSVRLLDPDRGKIDEVVQICLPQLLHAQSQCERVNDCYCGQAVQQEQAVIHVFARPPENSALPGADVSSIAASALCQIAGFASIAVFHIRYSQHNAGVFTLFFRQPRRMQPQEQNLLEALGIHLGVAIENTRLEARDRQLAVMEERNLMAQGLHDSIAQSLSFLNLQVQMLESALAAGEQEQAHENLAFIRTGVQESYEDVRELLLNFRVRINKQELPQAVRTLLDRFEKQARVGTHLDMTGDGLPLDPQQQLQVIFILQEALSNVRKHAQASRVDVRICNEEDFVMGIVDDGRGIDMDAVAARKARHVGLSIMQERARRIHADIAIAARPEGGTIVTLTLPKKERIVT